MQYADKEEILKAVAHMAGAGIRECMISHVREIYEVSARDISGMRWSDAVGAENHPKLYLSEETEKCL